MWQIERLISNSSHIYLTIRRYRLQSEAEPETGQMGLVLVTNVGPPFHSESQIYIYMNIFNKYF
jgi:hypothetical protein